MAIIAAISSVQDVINILYVAIGLGLVIFIHELGHFAVAKWCGVKVERFSIGFGPILWRYTRGETEYALSAIPFGGYVKMLGQDDADPSQLTDQSIARDPRSFTSKSVPQRMAIISAGVFNNMVSAVLFFMLAFMLGVQYQPAVIGAVVPGMPAWEAGLRLGDQLTSVAGRADPQFRFMDVRQAIALSDGGPVKVSGLRNGKPFETEVTPQLKGQLVPTIGIEPEPGLKLAEYRDQPKETPTLAGSPAALAKPGFQQGDLIRKLDEIEIENYSQLLHTLAERRDQTVEFHVRRKGESPDEPLHVVSVEPNHFRTLGLRMDIGKITAIQKGSPAEGKLQVNDKITHLVVDNVTRSIGVDIDPLRLPGELARLHGREVTLRVKREVPAGDPEVKDIVLTPENRPGWIERPMGLDCPISIPAIGVAYHVLHHVLKVEPGSPAEGKVFENDNILMVQFVPPKNEAEGEPDREPKPIEFKEDSRNWPVAFWLMQEVTDWKVVLTVKSQGKAEPRTVELVPQPDTEWYIPLRGFMMQPLTLVRKAGSIQEAVVLGLQHTRDSIVDMWLTVRRLTQRRISIKALGGPIRIAQTAYLFSERGIPDLILFLGILSVSLAVLNFLPIPVLDGGHFMFLCWEGIRGKPASERVVMAATYVGLLMVLSLMVWVLYMDISSLVVGR